MFYYTKQILVSVVSESHEMVGILFFILLHTQHILSMVYGIGHVLKDNTDNERKPTATT